MIFYSVKELLNLLKELFICVIQIMKMKSEIFSLFWENKRNAEIVLILKLFLNFT